MFYFRIHPVLLSILALACCLFVDAAPNPVWAQAVQNKKGIVATVHPIATDAGLAALKRGGNAIDAAVAAAVTLGVVDGHNSGLGGGCFVLIRTASGRLFAIDGRETAPTAATRDMFLQDGSVVPERSTTGPLAIGVPGALAAYEKAMAAHGKLQLSDLLNRAATHAEMGFAVDRIYAGNLSRTQSALLKCPGAGRMFLKEDGSPYGEGETLRLPDLAKSYRAIAKDGIDWFYRGRFAKDVGKWMASSHGLLTAEDFANYEAKDRQPILSTYRDYTIVGFPPPSSGGIHVAQILNILEHFDIRTLLRYEPTNANHVVAEAMKLAFADRAHWLGDADFARVPTGLVQKSYANELAAKIKMDGTIAVAAHGLPPNWRTDVYGKHTTHVATADAAGNWVAITATVNTSFGSKVVVPGTGIVLNNEMDDFSAQPGTPNVFGLVGAEANAVAPGKRPLSSMSPTIVLKDGVPVFSVGAAGGPKIITQVVLAILRFVDAELPVSECVGRPRLHHQWRPDRLFLEETASSELVAGLRLRGHEIEFLASGGITQAISQLSDGTFVGVSDPRVPGKAAGY